MNLSYLSSAGSVLGNVTVTVLFAWLFKSVLYGSTSRVSLRYYSLRLVIMPTMVTEAFSLGMRLPRTLGKSCSGLWASSYMLVLR